MSIETMNPNVTARTVLREQKRVASVLQREEAKRARIAAAKVRDIPDNEEEKNAFIEKNSEALMKIKDTLRQNSANWFAFEFQAKYPGHFVLCKDVQEYCSNRTKEVKGEILGDPPRAFELCRKNVMPLDWDEQQVGRLKLVRYNPDKRHQVTNEIVEQTMHRNDCFSRELIKQCIEKAGYKCELTGLPVSEGALAADHFWPKEQGGESIEQNCVIINKILNEKKNNHDPIEWFCKSLLTNFMTLCRRVGGEEMLKTCKEKIITFVNEF
jgi:5-methylcytosine-specific restriction endonuclease McrA